MPATPSTFALLALVSLPLACTSRGGDAGGETHWQKSFLAGCVSDSHCEAPLTCIRNMCTRPCTEDDACDVERGDLCDGDGRCVVPERQGCTSDDPCGPRHEGWLCDEVVVDDCRVAVSVCRDGAWIRGVLDACRGALVETSPATDDQPETIRVKRSETDAPVDVLFVVDNSGSMHNEQARLAAEVPAFVERMSGRGVGDFRVAVTSPDVQCDPDDGHVARGRFSTRPAAFVPFAAAVSLTLACAEDTDCAEPACDVLGCEPEATRWQCSPPSAEVCIELPNGSFGSRCQLECTTDEHCTTVLGPGFSCVQASPFDFACLATLPACPEEHPPILAGDDLSLAPCALRIGTTQERCLLVEQPLEAMRQALDPAGPIPDQHAAFVRAHAILAVVVVTDEEDCSLAPERPLSEDEYERCGLAATVAAGGPLQTVEHYAGFLVGLKPPGRTFFATLAGDSTATEPAVIEAERAAYLASKGAAPACHAQTTICTTPDQRDAADWSPRLFAMADQLAPDSHADNICGGDWGAAFERLGDALAETATRICLPRAPSVGFAVTRVVGGDPTTLVQVDAGSARGTWRLAAEAPECESGVAIIVADPPVVGEVLRLSYPQP